MKPERWQQLDELFHAALQHEPEERAAFLDEGCAGDEALRRQVEALLAAHEEAGSFIENPAGSKHFEWFEGQVEAQVESIGALGAISLDPATGQPR